VFLNEEIEAPAGRFAAGHLASGFFVVSGEPVELFGDVVALQLQNYLLLHAFTVDGGEQLRDPFMQARAHAGLDFRQTRAHLGDQLSEPRATLFDEFAQALAFAQAHRTKLFQCLLEHRAARD
jgi:hypothetical protein